MSKEFHHSSFIYFDLGGVLFDFKGGLDKLSQLMGLPLDECTKVWRSFDNEICRGQMTCQQLWGEYKKVANYKGQDINFSDFWVSNFLPNNKMHQLVLELSEQYPIGLLTNIYPEVFAIAMSTGKIPQANYTSIVQSCDYGVVKPEHKIYQIAQEKTKLKPENIFLIDDSALFVDSATQEGWNGILFTGSDTVGSINKIKQQLI